MTAAPVEFPGMLAAKLATRIDSELVTHPDVFCALLGEALAEPSDATRYDREHRAKLGASAIGHACARKIWLGFHWATDDAPDARLLRLFNRGHLEEARIAALLRLAGVDVWRFDPETGEQYKGKAADHGPLSQFAGSLDGVIFGVPDMPNEYALLEGKTYNTASFNKLIKHGVQASAPQHYDQMQAYMHNTRDKLGLTLALYFAVCKEDDRLHLEIIAYDPDYAERLELRALAVLQMRSPPFRMNDNPTWWQCKICDHNPICHQRQPYARNCRTCKHARFAHPDDQEHVSSLWRCGRDMRPLLVEDQRAGCADYTYGFRL